MLGYPGWSMPVCEMDVRPGGKYRWRWRSDEGGQEFGFFGEFSEVDAPASCPTTEYYDPGNIGGAGAMPTRQSRPSSAHLSPRRTASPRWSLLMDFGSKEARDAAVSTGMTDGMEMRYERLDTMFAATAGRLRCPTSSKSPYRPTARSASRAPLTPRAISCGTAHTKPELVRRWLLGPPGWEMPVCEIDLRVGGKYRYEWEDKGRGKKMGMGGVIHRR